MPIVLSLAQTDEHLWAAGPEGLFQIQGESFTPIPQPQQELACCGALGDRILVGGLPHGVAFTIKEPAPVGEDTADAPAWQAAWMDGVDSPVLCFAADPHAEVSGVLLAGSAEGGVLRSANRGQTWVVSNFGLQDYSILSLVWAPPAPENTWPRWQVVFAGAETGLYRSPNGGLGWRRTEGLDGVVQSIAVAPDFHTSGVVLAGTESSGLWRSTDGGRTFTPVDSLPARIDALAATPQGWVLSDEAGLWHSADGAAWTPIPESRPALVIQQTTQGLIAGGEYGIQRITLPVAA